MKPILRTSIDARRIARAQAAPPFEVLGSFLEEDVQGSIASTQSFLDRVQEVRAGSRLRWEGTGNAHSVTITTEAVRIENEWASPPAATEVSLDDFEEALHRWMHLLVGQVGA